MPATPHARRGRRWLALAATAAAASLSLSFAAIAPAQAAAQPHENPQSALSAQAPSTAGTSATQAIADATLSLPEGTELQESDRLTIPVDFLADAGQTLSLRLVRSSDQSAVPGAEVEGTAGADGAGTATIPASAVQAGTYKVVADDGLKQSGTITVAPAADPTTPAANDGEDAGTGAPAGQGAEATDGADPMDSGSPAAPQDSTSAEPGSGTPSGTASSDAAPSDSAPSESTPSGSASADPTTDATASQQAEGTTDQSATEKSATEKSATEKSAEQPTGREDGLDEYYPELAKKMFDPKGTGTYTVTKPAKGGTSAGRVPAGLKSYYAQKIDWSQKNCDLLGYNGLAAKYSEALGQSIQCGYMIAPIDSAKPASGNLAIGVMRVKAKGASKGAVMWNPGGPGGSGMTMAIVGARDEPDLAEHYDMIGFDPRGVGASMPYSQCSSDAQIDADRAVNSFGKTQKVAEKEQWAITKRYTKDCFENTGKAFGMDAKARTHLMKHLGTWDAVGDLDLLRSVTGNQKLNYVGFSYGTRLGYVYAQKFQASAGRLVLDGVVDPGDAASIKALKSLNASSTRYQDLGSAQMPSATSKGAASDGDLTADELDNISQGAGFQDTFEQYALDCAAKGPSDPAKQKTWGELWPELFGEGGDFEGATGLENSAFVCPLGDSNDPKVLSANNAKLLQTLEVGNGLPVDADEPNGAHVTFADGRTGVFQALYSQDLWPLLNAGLMELADGQSAGILMMLADEYNGRDPETGHYDPSQQAFTTIRCTDGNNSADPASIAHLRKVAKAYDEAAPFQAGSITVGVPDYCQFWDFTGTLPQSQKLTKVPNVLVVSTSHDPATPYANGPKLARLIDGTLLSVSGASHTSYDSGVACVDDTVNDFLINGTVPKDGDLGEKLATPDTTKDDRGNKVTFTTECKVKTYRASGFETSTKKAYAKDKVGFVATHFDSEATYSVRLVKAGSGKGAGVVAAATAKVSTVTTDNGGNVTGVFQVPAKAAAGRYVVQLVSAKGAVVDTKPLTVMARPVPAKPKPPVVKPPVVKPQPTQPTGTGTGTGTGAGTPTGSGEQMANTGAEATPWIVGGAAALILGAGALLLSRRRGRQH